MACGRIRPGAGVRHLLRRAVRGFELGRSLRDQVAGLGDLLFSRNNLGAIRLHGLRGCGGFRFAGIVK